MLTAGRLAVVLIALGAAACARIEPPPGGAPDQKAPTLIGTHPDSLRILPDFSGSVEFLFNEVISEGGQPSEGRGTGDLEKLVLLSPSNNVPMVEWKRNRIAVHPREGWQKNRVYRVQLLPGVADVRNNRGAQSSIVTFTTGAPLPDFTLTGKVFDWSTGQAARGALLEAVLEPDSLVYRSATDSTGGFRFGPLPRGTYVVYATVDQNRNLRRDRRESFDSAHVVGDSGAVPELWMFAHDTAPPKLQTPTLQDSVTVVLPFNQKLDPALRTDTTNVTLVRLPDSARVAVRSLLPAPLDDSIVKAARLVRDSLARDSAAARGDTLARPPVRPDTAAPKPNVQAPPPQGPPRPQGAPAPAVRPAPDSARAAIGRLDSALAGKRRDSTRVGPKPSRPPLNDRLVLRLAEPLVPGGKYSVEVRGVRNVNGATGDSRAGFTVPERPKPPSDSTKAKGQKGKDKNAPPGAPVPVPPADSTRPDSAVVHPRTQPPQRR